MQDKFTPPQFERPRPWKRSEMLACVPSSSNLLPPLKKLKGLEAPLNRFESPLKNCAWQTPPTKRTATAEESGTRGLMLAMPQVEWDWPWVDPVRCHFQN